MKKRKLYRGRLIGLCLTLGICCMGMQKTHIAQAADNNDGSLYEGGYIPSKKDYNTSVVTVNKNNLLYAAEPERRYVNLDGFPAIRNQNPYGACWAFSSLALTELSLLKQGYSGNDLSEEHLAYYTYHTAVDPMGLTAGDTASLSGSNSKDAFLQAGGNYDMSMVTLANWKGAAEETRYPYAGYINGTTTYTTDDAFNYDVAHLQNVYRVNIKQNQDLAKQLIKENGAIGVAYFHKETYYSTTYNSFYGANNSQETNHAVCIVGWDDDFPATNFAGAQKPSQNGAWLVRNSWGATDSNKYSYYGYFWMSYQEPSLSDTGYAFTAVYKGQNGYYDKNYYYDAALLSGEMPLSAESRIANVFRITSDLEELKAVSFETGSENVNYTISIYQLKDDYSNPEDGLKLGEVSGSTTYEGLYTVPLPEGIPFTKGTYFSVVVTLHSAANICIEYSAEINCDKTKVLRSVAAITPKTSYRGYPYGNSQIVWSERTSSVGGDFRLKAYTNVVTDTSKVAPTSIRVTSPKQTLGIGKNLQLSAQVLPDNASDKKVFWSSSNTDIATVSEDGIVTALSPGKVTISAQARLGNTVGSVEITVTKAEFCDSQGTVIEYVSCFTQESKELILWIQPTKETYSGRNVTWSVENESIASIDQNGKLTAKAAGSTVVTAEYGDMKAQMTVYVIPKVKAFVEGNYFQVEWEAVSNHRCKVTYETKSGQKISQTYTSDSDFLIRFSNMNDAPVKVYLNILNNAWEEYPGTSTADVEYRITYNLQGGTNHSDNPTSFVYSAIKDKAIPLYAPSKEGYNFTGWAQDSASGKMIEELPKGVLKPYVLYAVWEKKPESKPDDSQENEPNGSQENKPGSTPDGSQGNNPSNTPDSSQGNTSGLTPENNYDNEKDYRFTIPVAQAGTKVAAYQGCNFYEDGGGNKRCYKDNGVPVINEFKCDGTYTYYFQMDGTCMKSRLTYHPDGEHVIYLDENGHEVFSNFANVKQTISGQAVDDFCFFDVHGYLYVDVVTFDQTGTKLYYANQYGVMERGKWFEFSDTCKWADGNPFDKAGGKYGYAMEDGTLMTNTTTYDWEGRLCYMQGNGVAKY